MVAADLAGAVGITGRQGAHTGELEDDVLAAHVQVREDLRNHPQDVVDLFIGAAGFFRILDVDIRRADHDLVFIGVDEHDAPVEILKEELMIANGRPQFGIVDDQVRAFGAADEAGWQAHRLVGKVDPGSGGVNHDLRLHIKGLAGFFIAQGHSCLGRTHRTDVVQRQGLLTVRFRVFDDFHADAFR